MTFEIESLSKAKITDVMVLSQKNRDPEANPGVALQFELQQSNSVLAYFDGSLKSFLYTKGAATTTPTQQGLEGVDDISDAPNLTPAGLKLGKLHWDQDLTGYELVIDHGMGGKSNITLESCLLSGFRLEPKEGGTVIVSFKLESQDVTEGTFGKLATLKNREVQILLTPPVVDQAPIE